MSKLSLSSRLAVSAGPLGTTPSASLLSPGHEEAPALKLQATQPIQEEKNSHAQCEPPSSSEWSWGSDEGAADGSEGQEQQLGVDDEGHSPAAGGEEDLREGEVDQREAQEDSEWEIEIEDQPGGDDTDPEDGAQRLHADAGPFSDAAKPEPSGTAAEPEGTNMLDDHAEAAGPSDRCMCSVCGKDLSMQHYLFQVQHVKQCMARRPATAGTKRNAVTLRSAPDNSPDPMQLDIREWLKVRDPTLAWNLANCARNNTNLRYSLTRCLVLIAELGIRTVSGSVYSRGNRHDGGTRAQRQRPPLPRHQRSPAPAAHS